MTETKESNALEISGDFGKHGVFSVLRCDHDVDRVVFTADAVDFTRQRNSR